VAESQKAAKGKTGQESKVRKEVEGKAIKSKWRRKRKGGDQGGEQYVKVVEIEDGLGGTDVER